MVPQSDAGSIERGAAEDASGVPVTETDIETSVRPASQPRPDRGEDPLADSDIVSQGDGSGMAGGSSGGSGGGSSLPGHPDAS